MTNVMISENRQITLPETVCQRLGVTVGDTVSFVEENGKIILVSSMMTELHKLQNAFEGEAERLGLKDMDDVVAMIKDVRKEIADEKTQNHA